MLRQMGNTADEVAGVLREKKIQGVRNTVRMLNPIVRYVETLIPDTQDADVIEQGVLRMTFRNGAVEHVALPASVEAFLDAFNRASYPELELPAGQG
jgi:hypothetical protein